MELQKRPLAEGKGREGMDQEFINKAEKNPLTSEQERRLESACCIAKANGEGLRVKVAEMPGFGMTTAEARGRNSNHGKLVAVSKEGG